MCKTRFRMTATGQSKTNMKTEVGTVWKHSTDLKDKMTKIDRDTDK